MQNSLRRRLRSDRLLFFFITRISPTLELLSSLQIHLQRDAASRVPYCLCTPHTNKLPPNTYKNLLTFKTNSVKIALAF